MNIEDRIKIVNEAQAYLTRYGYANDLVLLERLLRFSIEENIAVTAQQIHECVLRYVVDEHFSLVSYFKGGEVPSGTAKTLIAHWMIVFVGWSSSPYATEKPWYGLDGEAHGQALPRARH